MDKITFMRVVYLRHYNTIRQKFFMFLYSKGVYCFCDMHAYQKACGAMKQARD